MLSRLLTLFTLLCATSLGQPVAQKQEPPAITAAERQANIDSFEFVWKTVRDKHWDPKLLGLDWQAIHDELRPKVEQATTMADARAAMSEMLGRLKQTHFGIVPGTVYRDLESPSSTDGAPGIDVRIVDGKPIVVSVEPDSPAAALAVKPGWQIVRVDGADLEPRLTAVRKQFASSTMLDLVLARSVISRLNGPIGKAVTVEFLDGSNKPVVRDIQRVKPRGTVAHLGNMPPLYFWAEKRTLPEGVGYITFNVFFEPDSLIATVRDAVKSCSGCRGFIVDVRGNPGGIGGLAMGVAGFFVDKPGQQLGTMFLRNAKMNFVIFPRQEAFTGPLAILVDGGSASTSEIFAGGLKDLARARVFGTRTAAAALPSVFERLPNGDGFQYAIANYIAVGGKPLEGEGVIPDQEVNLTRRALLDGHDPVVDAAVEWIKKQGKH